jgi:hypothetical protein
MDFHGEQFEVVTDRMQGKKQNQDIARQLRMERERSERKDKGKQRKQDHQSNRNQESRNESRIEARHDSRNESRNESRHESRHESRSEGGEANPAATEQKVMVPKPSGMFIASAAKPVQPVVKPAPAAAQQSAAPAGDDDETQPDFNAQAPAARSEPPHDFSDMDDEDQLAYLRAQAAQDAAIASLGSNSPAPGQGNQRFQRGQNFRNQNQQQGNHRNAGGRNQNNNRNQNQGRNRNQQQQNRSNRFRPQTQGGNLAPQAMEARPRSMDAAPEAVVVPDYEVLNRQGDGSES